MDTFNELLKGSVAIVALSLLRERSMYAYEMAPLVLERTDGVLKWREGSLYPALHKLEKQGCIAGTWRDVKTARGAERRRKYYTLTPRGRRELQDRVHAWKELTIAVGRVIPKNPADVK